MRKLLKESEKSMAATFLLGLNPELRRTIKLEFSKEPEDKKTLLNYAERAGQVDSVVVGADGPSRERSVYESLPNISDRCLTYS